MLVSLVASCLFLAELDASPAQTRLSTAGSLKGNSVEGKISSDQAFETGLKYLKGDGVQQDTAKAASFLKIAADQGIPGAQRYYALLLYKGEGVTANPLEAVIYMRKSARNGDAKAQYLMGGFYFSGDVVRKDLNEAVRWYQMSAGQNDINALYMLGKMTLYGQGLQKDTKEGLRMLAVASDGGHDKAPGLIGYTLMTSAVTAEDRADVLRYLTQGAERGDVFAQHGLGAIYAAGIFADQNYVQAYRWFNIAAAQGSEKSIAARDELEKLMTYEEVQLAQDMSIKTILK